MLRRLLPLSLAILSGLANAATPSNNAYLQVKFEGSQGEQVSSVNYNLLLEENGITQISKVGSNNQTFGPFKIELEPSIIVKKATSKDGYIASNVTEKLKHLAPGTNTYTIPLTFNQWQFKVTGINLQYDKTVDAATKAHAKGTITLYIPNQHIQNPSKFPIDSAILSRNTVASPYAEYSSDNGLYGIQRLEVKPGTQSVSFNIPVSLINPSKVGFYNLMVLITDVDAEHPVTLFKSLQVYSEAGNFVGLSNTSRDTFYYTDLAANTPYRVCVSAVDMKNRVAANCEWVKYTADKNQYLNPLYTKVIGLKFVDSAAKVQVQTPTSSTNNTPKTSNLPSFDGIEKTLKSSGQSIVTSSPELTARANSPAPNNKAFIIFSMLQLQQGDVDDYSKPAILDPEHVEIVLQNPNGSNLLLSGAEAIKVMREHGFLVPGTLQLTSLGRQGYEMAPSQENTTAATPTPTTPAKDMYWVMELKLDIKAQMPSDKAGVAYYYGRVLEPSKEAAIAAYKVETRPVIGKGFSSFGCTYRNGQKTGTLEGVVSNWTISVVSGPYAESAAADKAKKAVDCF